MDNEINLTPEQIKNILSKFKSAKNEPSQKKEEILKEYLSTDQINKLKNVMNDPQLIRNILSSPSAIKILNQIKGEAKKDEP